MEQYIKNNIEYPYSLVTQGIRISVKTNFLEDQSDEDRISSSFNMTLT